MGDILCPILDDWGQALMDILSGSVIRITPGKGLPHAVKTKPWPSHEQMREQQLFKMLDDEIR